MGMKAEELGVEIYPGFAASEVLLVLLACDPSAYYWMVCNTSYVICQILYDANDKVIGIATNDMGVAKDGSKKENYQRGVELKGISLSLSHTHTHTHTHKKGTHKHII
jgi:electron-transferring-flavoprotein dehydrogenase